MGTMSRKNRIILYAVLFAAAVVLPLLIRGVYNRNVLILALTYAVLGSGWNILSGYAGQNSLGNAIFFATGAYTSTLLSLRLDISPWIGMAAGVLVAVLFAALIGIPFFRLQKYYYTLATIALLQIMNVIVSRQEALGGARGLTIRIGEDSFWKMQFAGKIPYYYIILGILIVVLVIVHWMDGSKMGYYLRTLKMNQEAAESLGVSVRFYKTLAICLGAAFTAAAGTFYAQYIKFIDPVSIISADKSTLMCLVAVFGGMGTVWGPVIGACIIVPIAEYTRTIIGGTGSGIDMIIYGALLLVIVLYKPSGVLGIIHDICEKFKVKKRKKRESVNGG